MVNVRRNKARIEHWNETRPAVDGEKAKTGSRDQQGPRYHSGPQAKVPDQLVTGRVSAGSVIPRELVSEPTPDPYVVALPAAHSISGRERLWLVGTTNESNDTFRVFCSANKGISWNRATDDKGAPLSIFAADAMPAWISRAAPDRWAPEIHPVDGRLLLLYTARHKDGDLRVAAAVADTIEGPWNDLGPILQRPNGVIDATVTRDQKTGEWVLMYKGDDNAVGQPTPILTQSFKLVGDKLQLSGREHQIMISGKDDGGLVEGPFVVNENGKTYLFVSSDYFGDARYKTWISEVDDLQHGTASPHKLFLSSDSPSLHGNWAGPGHISMLPVGEGIYKIYFHAWKKGTEGKAGFENRFRTGEEQRKALSLTVAFRDKDGKPCEPYIVEDEIARRSSANLKT